MRTSTSKILQRYGFWLSLLLHLLLLLNFLFIFKWQNNNEWKKKPSLEIPSYISQEVKPSMVRKHQRKSAQKNISTDKTGLLNPSMQNKSSLNSPPSKHEDKEQTLAKKTHKNPVKSAPPSKNLQGVNLVGDGKAPEPLVKILSMAVSAHLAYPKIAEDFGLRGIAYVGFTIHPDGQVTNVQLVKTSSAEVLDQAAISAVSAIAPVGHVGQYLQEPLYLVIGFIFG